MELVEILAYLMPSIIVLFVAYFMFRKLLDQFQVIQGLDKNVKPLKEKPSHKGSSVRYG